MDPDGDGLRDAIRFLLPPELVYRRGGPERASPRAALDGILRVVRHGLRRNDLPLEPGFSSGVARWRRLRRWQARGVWRVVH